MKSQYISVRLKPELSTLFKKIHKKLEKTSLEKINSRKTFEYIIKEYINQEEEIKQLKIWKKELKKNIIELRKENISYLEIIDRLTKNIDNLASKGGK